MRGAVGERQCNFSADEIRAMRGLSYADLAKLGIKKARKGFNIFKQASLTYRRFSVWIKQKKFANLHLTTIKKLSNSSLQSFKIKI